MPARRSAVPTGRQEAKEGLSVDPLAVKYPGWSPYNYCVNNPMVMIDPSGCLGNKFDSTGVDIKGVELGGWIAPNGKKGNLIIGWKVATGYVTADDGETKVEATKAISEPSIALLDDEGKEIMTGQDVIGNNKLDISQNCIASAFSQGELKLWINPDQVPNIIKGDSYKEITNGSAQRNDVILYGDNNSTDHAAWVLTVNTNGSVYSVLSKGGVQEQKITAPGPGPNSAWGDANSTKTLLRK
ncbi:MAG: hypothetical protein GXX85_04700 [Ignavibacteria bacterium]|nr:hypothetical protein [Ignavibacteria bacterium]